MTNQLPPALIAGGLWAADLPTTGERPALVLQAQSLAREQGALVIAWPRWDMAVITRKLEQSYREVLREKRGATCRRASSCRATPPEGS